MIHQPRVAASILAADFALLQEVASAVRSGADLLHVDVMDHQCVPNLTVGPLVCAALRRITRVPLDVHLMVKPVDAFVRAFAKAGADAITFHPEASQDVRRTVMLVKEHGCSVGLALNPATPLCVLDHLLGDLDLVLLTSVSPGFDGQRFMPSALRNIRALREQISARGRHVSIAVEGGVGADTAAELLQAGADTLVAGSVLLGSNDHAGTIAALKGIPASPLRGVAWGIA